MIKQIWKRFTSLLLSAVMLLSFFVAFPSPAYAANSGTLSGLSNSDIGATYSSTDDGTYASWTVDGATGITGNIKSKDGGSCGSDTKYNTTLTLTNNKDTTAILSFSYKITLNNGSAQVAGTAVTEDGNYSTALEPGASVKVFIESGSADNATTIKISNLSLIVNVPVTTTFIPTENGSYTVDGIEIVDID